MLVESVGPLSDESRVGEFVHAMHGLSRNGLPLGTVHAESWTRPFPHVSETERRTPRDIARRSGKLRKQNQSGRRKVIAGLNFSGRLTRLRGRREHARDLCG